MLNIIHETTTEGVQKDGPASPPAVIDYDAHDLRRRTIGIRSATLIYGGLMNQRNLEQQSNEETCKFFVLEVKWGGVDQVRKANVTTQEASEEVYTKRRLTIWEVMDIVCKPCKRFSVDEMDTTTIFDSLGQWIEKRTDLVNIDEKRETFGTPESGTSPTTLLNT